MGSSVLKILQTVCFLTRSTSKAARRAPATRVKMSWLWSTGVWPSGMGSRFP